MRTIKIGNEEYKFKYSIEASLYSECTEKITGLMLGIAGSDSSDAKRNFIVSLSNIPQTALHIFHAGLLEYQNVTFSDSKRLIAQYINEHKNDETGSFYGVLNMLIEDMEKDGFFELIGLGEMLKRMEAKTTTAKDSKEEKAETEVTEK